VAGDASGISIKENVAEDGKEDERLEEKEQDGVVRE
jgi:hypothetical protein